MTSSGTPYGCAKLVLNELVSPVGADLPRQNPANAREFPDELTTRPAHRSEVKGTITRLTAAQPAPNNAESKSTAVSPDARDHFSAHVTAICLVVGVVREQPLLGKCSAGVAEGPDHKYGGVMYGLALY